MNTNEKLLEIEIQKLNVLWLILGTLLLCLGGYLVTTIQVGGIAQLTLFTPFLAAGYAVSCAPFLGLNKIRK